MQTNAGAREAGLNALKAGDATMAVSQLQEAVRLQPVDAEAWSALGIALCQVGRVPEGVAALERGISQNGGRAPFHFNLAKGLELSGRSTDALQAYRRCLQLDPGHAGAAAAVQRLDRNTRSMGEFALPGTSTAPVAPPSSPQAVPTPPPLPSVPPPPWATGATSSPGYGPSPGSTPYGSVSPAGAPYGYTSAPPPPGPPPPPFPGPGRMAAPYSGGAPARGRTANRSSGAPIAIVIGVILAVIAGMVAVVGLAVRSAIMSTPGGAGPAIGRTGPTSPIAGSGSTGSGESSTSSFWPFGSQKGIKSTSGGPRVSDDRYGFQVTFPNGFPAPQQEHMTEPVGLGGTAGKQVYECGTGEGHAYVLCVALAGEVYDKADQSRLLEIGRKIMADLPFGSIAQHQGSQFAGNAAEDVRYSTHSMGQPRNGRGRTILARPRIFVIGFESTRPENLDEAGVGAFLDSLQIAANVTPPDARAPIQLPRHEIHVPSMPHFTPPTPPQFTPPTPPTFTPPTIPRFNPSPIPRFNPPTVPRFTPPSPPNFPQSGSSGRPPFGPRFGPRFGPGSGPSATPNGGTPGPPGGFSPPSAPGTPGAGNAPNGTGPTVSST